MPNHLSVLGIIHTAISILAIVAAVVALLTTGKINPAKGAGKAYLWLTILTCLTALPIMKTGHLTPGHFLAVVILGMLPIAVFAKAIKPIKKIGEYVQVLLMSTTLFLSMIPTTVETLTRLPMSAPLAADANSPLIQKVLLVWVVCLFVGVTYQFIKIRKTKKAETAANTDIAKG